MQRLLGSLESFRTAALALVAVYAALVAAMVYFRAPEGLLLAAICAGGALIILAVITFTSLVSRTLQDNITQAKSIASGHYTSAFRQLPDQGLMGQSQEALREMLKHLKYELSLSRGIMHSMATPCAVTDTEENFIFGNQKLVDMLEHEGRPEDFYGQNVAVFFYGEKRQTVLGTAMQENRWISKEVEFTGRKGSKRNIHIDASPLHDIEGKLLGSLCIYTDLSKIRASEARIKEQNRIISSYASQATSISESLASSSRDLAAQVEQASRGAESQTSLAGQTATSMEQMNSTVMEVARNASAAAQEADQARDMAREGSKVVEDSVAAINKVHGKSRELQSSMDSLGKQAQEIGNIMNVIEDIADQTNLLALNAAIEAARAGDAGRGFAVVADEVRKLAEKTMKATREVGQAVSSIQDGANSNIQGMDQASALIEEANSLANRSGEALEDIVRRVQKATEQVQAIATATEEQSAASEEVNRNIEEVNRISRETSEVMTQSSESVAELSRQAQELKDLVQQLSQQ